MKNSFSYVRIAVPFIWAGFIGAISFMEAWLKFRAPGVTLAVGLGVALTRSRRICIFTL